MKLSMIPYILCFSTVTIAAICYTIYDKVWFPYDTILFIVITAIIEVILIKELFE